MMRTTVPPRQLSYWHHTLSMPSMVNTTKMCTSLGTLPMTDCCLRGTHTHTRNITTWVDGSAVSQSDWWICLLCWNLACGSFPVGLFNDILRKQFCAVQHPLRWSHCVCVCVHRVLEQHKLTKEQWEDRIQTWHEEHREMLRYVSNCPYRRMWMDVDVFYWCWCGQSQIKHIYKIF